MESKGKVVTVLGDIQPKDVGVTMTHEHLFCDVAKFFVPPKKSHDEKMCKVDFQMNNLGWIRQNPNSHKENLRLFDEIEAVREELKTYKQHGGQTIVENTTYGIGRDAKLLKSMSEDTGVNVIAGTGFYVGNFQSASSLAMSEEKMAEVMRSELIDGIDGIRCGLIGEVGTTWPIMEFEKKSLRSSAVIQSELGAPLMIHPGRSSQAPEEIMRIVLEAGGVASRTVIAHLDRTLIDPAQLLEFTKFGTYLEYDLFGLEVSHYQLNESVDMPSDGQRVAAIKLLMDNGLEDRVLVAHDVHTKHRLTKFGGHGYSHILVNVVPKMLARGISQTQVDKILKYNPQQWLTFV